MDKDTITKALAELKQQKRKFSQTVDLIVNLKALDMKKPENQLDFFVLLNHRRSKKSKLCALVGPELKAEAEKTFDTVIEEKDFEKYAKNKPLAKKLADDHMYFVAQANIMPKVASAFGRIFGPKKKMPNPKAGCIVPPKANLGPVYEKLQKTVAVLAKERPMVQLTVGTEDMSDEELIDNITTIYNQLINHLPAEKNNIKRVLLKLTMSKPVEL